MKFNELFEEKELTVMQLCTLTGLGTQTIRDLINGKTLIKNAKLDTAKKIADAFKITIDELYNAIDDEDEQKPKKRGIVEFRELINNNEEIVIQNDWEYSLWVGQLAYYMQKHSKVTKTQAYINQFFDCNTQKSVNNALQKNFKLAKTNSKRFNYIFALVLGYDNLKKFDKGALLGGYLGENLIYLNKDDEK